jgi:hypothetical protein
VVAGHVVIEARGGPDTRIGHRGVPSMSLGSSRPHPRSRPRQWPEMY